MEINGPSVFRSNHNSHHSPARRPRAPTGCIAKFHYFCFAAARTGWRGLAEKIYGVFAQMQIGTNTPVTKVRANAGGTLLCLLSVIMHHLRAERAYFNLGFIRLQM
jgi:hypothetical protein